MLPLPFIRELDLELNIQNQITFLIKFFHLPIVPLCPSYLLFLSLIVYRMLFIKDLSLGQQPSVILHILSMRLPKLLKLQFVNEISYLSLRVGRFINLSHTRHDIAYFVNEITQFMHAP